MPPESTVVAVDAMEGLAELMALSFGWFLEMGQLEFMQLSLEDQLSFAQTYGHLSGDGFVKALQLLGSFCEARLKALK